MNLKSERLHLRNYSTDDADNYFRLKSCKSVWKYSTYIPCIDKVQAETELIQLIEMSSDNPYVFNTLFINDTNTYIGEAGILAFNKDANRCVIGYNLLPTYWNHGFATEITKALVRYAFQELKTERVEALTQKENIASRKVLERSGLLLEGILKHFGRIDGNYIDVCYYGMTSNDYVKL